LHCCLHLLQFQHFPALCKEKSHITLSTYLQRCIWWWLKRHRAFWNMHYCHLAYNHLFWLNIPTLGTLSKIQSSKQTPWPESESEQYRPSDGCLSTKLVPTFADWGCCTVGATNPYGHILGFLDRSHYYFFQEAPQLDSWGWEDPAPDPSLLWKSGSTGNRTRTSGSVAWNS
jgi:hypothetical protein